MGSSTPFAADEAMLRSLFTATPDALWVIDLDGRTVFANQRLAELLGRPIEELVDLDAFLVADEQGRVDLEHHLQQMREGHPGAENEEVQLLRPDGTTIWSLVSWTPMRDAVGEVTGYLHRLCSYSERRRLVDALREREQQLANAQSIARIGSWTWDVATDDVWWSDELYKLYDVAPEDFGSTYDAFLERLHPEDCHRVATLIDASVASGDGFEWEARVVTPRGQVKWVRGLGAVDLTRDGKVSRVGGTAQDITDLRTARDAAASAARRIHLLQQVAEASNRSTILRDALVRSATALSQNSSWHPLGTWVRTNPAEPPQLRQMAPARNAVPEPNLERALVSFASADVDIHQIPGRPGHSLVSLPVLRGPGSVSCVVQIAADGVRLDEHTIDLMRQIGDQLSRVAERERTASQLEEARDQAMAASRHKSEFLATMSHEIRTPMNGVIGLTELLLRTELNEGQHRLAEGLRSAGLALLNLINDILDLSKIESGRLELEHTTFDVRTVFEQTATILAGPAYQKGIELVVACHPDVPERLVGDPVRLGQVLANLGSNAVKFTDSGEVVIDAAAETVAPGHGAEGGEVLLRVSVRDSGIGLDPADAEMLFDAFTQADVSTTRRHAGTGLGLAISRRLVDAMAGEVGVDSALGVGSQFWFTARLGVAEPDPAPRPEAALRGRRALVVDDHVSAAALVARELDAWGMEVDIVNSSDEVPAMLAAAVAEGRPVDVALIDLEMPEVDGLELARRLRSRGDLGATALVLMARNPATSVAEIASAGYDGWTTSPALASTLREALLGVLTDASPTDAADPVSDPQQVEVDVLVAEDNPVNQMVATGLLVRLGCRVTVVADGVEAVEALRPGHHHDLVLMDCRMPRLDGYAATEQVRGAETASGARRVPIVALTASALSGERERCLEAGMDDFLTKPLAGDKLAEAVHRWGTGHAAPAPDPVGTAVGDEVPILDPERVEMLAEVVMDGVNFFDRTRTSYRSRIDATLAELGIAADESDPGRVASIAHALKGSSLNLGLARVGLRAAAIEDLARGGTLDGVAVLLAHLAADVHDGLEALDSAWVPAPSGS